MTAEEKAVRKEERINENVRKFSSNVGLWEVRSAQMFLSHWTTCINHIQDPRGTNYTC